MEIEPKKPKIRTLMDRWKEGTPIRASWYLWLPAVTALLLYMPALRGGLVWDDPLFLNHPFYTLPGLRWQALSRPFLLSPNYFRPLGVLTFVVEYAITPAPWLHHLVNAYLHALNTFLLTVTATRLIRQPGKEAASCLPILAVGLFYGVHPALVEGVAFISSRFDLLVTTFLLLALLADHALRGRRWLRPALVGLSVFMAALSKEMAAAIILVLPLWHLATHPNNETDETKGEAGESEDELSEEVENSHRNKILDRYIRRLGDDWKANLNVYLSVILGLAAYLALRYAALGYLYLPNAGRDLDGGNVLQHILLVFRTLAEYILLVLWPFTSLRPIHFSPIPLPLGSFLPWFSLIITLGVLALLGWRSRHDRRTGLLALAGVISLAPVLNILPLELGGSAFAAERFLLFPLALLALAAGSLLNQIDHRRFSPFLGIWVIGCIATIQLTVPHWRSDQALWEWGLQRAPLSATPYTNLSLVYTNQGNPAQGLVLAQSALQLDPNEANAHNHLGLALFHLGRYSEAETGFARAVEIEPGNALYWNNLAGALREQDLLADAERLLLDEALQLDPLLGAAHFNLGLVYLKADRPDLAANALAQALELLPQASAGEVQFSLMQTQEPERWLRLGDLLLNNGNPNGALQVYDQAEQLGANPLDLVVGRSAAWIASGELKLAEAALKAALLSTPEDPRLYNNLGLVAQEKGQLTEAQDYFETAIELAPEWDLPQQNLEALGP